MYRGDIFALVSLDAFDEDFGCGALLLRFGFCGGGFGGFLLCVFLGAFLGVDREGGEVLFDCLCIVILVLANESRTDCGVGRYLESTTSHAYADGVVEAILRISSLFRQTRNTVPDKVSKCFR